ncbi:copper amine oxidase N-terminal domain-containing protein [Anaerotignum lactatifermentans]|uniref:Copper amine oxidase N-terminal domain-containing protein n=1 Tax=Anaerotignum lactatifermentans TaxID=160404 RepID=A0ABS2GC49_9FIRM|nr:copper amine oxidase N-terminal domain-containing protein [Anaerotignum lactatifermentans]MBM6829944.1 copper amine oxidase N-terminal domain-containing protein [Anaerotignum lactatifermentans]MBM6878447.1 copper amine oxidase N-terminal domain-containing protein [Anaerotignum lactatifermentans]MBM6951631.1 copper amine oxidase N-terminal domain-containing protein [Anaerotignum lactatifermentans]
MKRFFMMLLAGAMTLGFAVPAAAQTAMTVEGTAVAQPLYVSESGVTMAPVRETAGLLGYRVVWDKESRSVTISDGTLSLSFAPGADAYTSRGRTRQLGMAPELKEGVLYAPAEIYSLYYPVTLTQNDSGLTLTALSKEGLEQVTGIIEDAAMYNLVLRLEDGTLRVFGKENADVSAAEGLLLGSTVTVYYRTEAPRAAVKIVTQPAG